MSREFGYKKLGWFDGLSARIRGDFRGREVENTLLLLEMLYPREKFRNQTFRKKTLVPLAISVWFLKFKPFTYLEL